MKWSIVLAALLLLPATARADDPCATDMAQAFKLCRAERPQPEIRATPATPRAGATVTLTAYAPSRDSTLAWDLDGDGAYDDATGATVTAPANGAAPVFAVRETDQFGRTGTDTVRLVTHAFNAHVSGTIHVTPAAPRVGRPVQIWADGTDPDGTLAKVELDADGDGSYETVGATRTLTFPTAGTRTVRARLTDDAGAVTTITETFEVHSENFPPRVSVQLSSASGSYSFGPLVAGPAVVTAYGNDPDGDVASVDFDLDGNGSYETHAATAGAIGEGLTGTAKTTFTAGDHEIGVRVADTDGGVATLRQSIPVVPAWPLTEPHAPTIALTNAGLLARPGVPTRLWATGFEPGETLTWDADGDGDFDDGTGAPLTFTYPAPGDYTARVKATSAGGTSIATGTVTVRDEPALAPVVSLAGPYPAFTTRPARFDAQATAADGGPTSAALSYDLDGDGDFDDVPGTQYDESTWTFPDPVTMAVRATVGGRSTVRTADITPLSGNLGPVAKWLRLPSMVTDTRWLAGTAVQLSADQGSMYMLDTCCSWAWTLDGAARDLVSPTAYGAGEHTVSLRMTAGDGSFAEERRTFSLGTAEPVAGFTSANSTVTSTSTDPDGGPVTLAWDLDGDRAFDDATGPSARALPGEHLVGVAATDAGGDVGISYATVTGDPVPPNVVPNQTAPKPAVPLKLTTRITAPRLKTLLAKGLTIKVTCSRACRTTGTAKLGKKVVARGSGKGTTLRLKLTAAGRKAIKHLHRFKLRVEVTSEGVKTTRTVTVKR